MKVFIKYGFIFEPADTWSNLYQFDQLFAKYLREMGLQAELVRSEDGQEKMKILYITKKQDAGDVKPLKKPDQTTSAMRKSLTPDPRRSTDGKFRKIQ